MRDGTYVVPLHHAERVQVYDRHMRFIRGWQLHSTDSTFKLLHASNRTDIEVALGHGGRLLVYAPDGTLLSRGSYAPTAYNSLADEAVSRAHRRPRGGSGRSPIRFIPSSSMLRGCC